MHPGTGLQLNEIVRALTELGGAATFKEIREQVTKNRNGDFSHYLNWENYEKRMRQIVHIHCPGYAHTGNTIVFEKADNNKYKFATDNKNTFASNPAAANNSSEFLKGETQQKIPQSITPTASDVHEPPPKILTEVYRVLRDTKLAREVKASYQFKCQICGNLPLKLGQEKFYAEAHHIKPLGSPHLGPDVLENVLCVCPNCHVLLDYGAIALDTKKLGFSEFHKVGLEFVNYHNQQIFQKV